jgi:hypothetical protein
MARLSPGALAAFNEHATRGKTRVRRMPPWAAM